MKSVLISIRPQWCELIAADMKTEELRKGKPKLELPFKCYIYQTRHKWLYDLLVRFDRLKTAQALADGLGKVIGEFVCDEMKPVHFNSLDKETICALAVGRGNAEWYKGSCVSHKDAYKYLRTAKKAYAWHISNLAIYDKPLPLSAFRRPCVNALYCESCGMYSENTGACGNGALRLTRPPQSWCYVEEM